MGWIRDLRNTANATSIALMSDALQTDVTSKGRAAEVRQEVSGQIYLNPLCSAYENIFPQVRPLIDELKIVRPYGVGRNGAKLPLARTPELQILDYPNEEMGWAEFADLMFAMWLTEKELNIHVWKNQRGKVYGYTVLPVGSRVEIGNGEYYFQTMDSRGEIEQLSPDEVMTLRYSRNPRNISQGVSPASSAFIWAQVDDLLAQYQRAFLENGAVPTTITIIRASTDERFQTVRKELEGQLKGAQNRNKTLYIWKQQLDDGDERDQVEVKPIQGNNSTLALKEIMSIVNDKLNKAYGVSEFILGNDSSAKYDNAELSDRQFTKRRVYPALVSFWGQFQHELDRVLPNGLPYAIQWDLEMPELTDRLKVKAEISQKNVENLTNLINAGSTAKAAVKALNLGEEWLDVAYSLYDAKQKAAQTATPSATPAASTDKASKAAIHECHCGHCHTVDIKTDAEITFSKDEKAEEEIYKLLDQILNSIVNEAAGRGVTLSEDDINKIKLSIVDELIKQADTGANRGAEEIVGQVLGATADEISQTLENGGYHVSEDFQKRLDRRTDELISRMSEQAREVAQEALKDRTGLSANQIKKTLREVMPAARAETIARNETVYAFRAGHLENDKYLAQKYGLKLRKTWRIADESACETCKAMDGKSTDIDGAFPDTVDGKDGYQYSWEQNSWNEDGAIPSAHVNCRCYFETEVVRE